MAKKTKQQKKRGNAYHFVAHQTKEGEHRKQNIEENVWLWLTIFLLD